VRIVDQFDVADGRTKTLLGVLERLQVQGRILLVLAEADELVRRAAGNLPNVFVTLPNGLSVLELLSADAVIFTEEAAHRVEELLAEPGASEGSGG
jgi:large subunit ribosomal protein L4